MRMAELEQVLGTLSLTPRKLSSRPRRRPEAAAIGGGHRRQPCSGRGSGRRGCGRGGAEGTGGGGDGRVVSGRAGAGSPRGLARIAPSDPMGCARQEVPREMAPMAREMCSKSKVLNEPRQWCARVFGVWVSCECFAARFFTCGCARGGARPRARWRGAGRARVAAPRGRRGGRGAARGGAPGRGAPRSPAVAPLGHPDQIKTPVNAWSTVGVNEHYTLRLAHPGLVTRTPIV